MLWVAWRRGTRWCGRWRGGSALPPAAVRALVGELAEWCGGGDVASTCRRFWVIRGIRNCLPTSGRACPRARCRAGDGMVNDLLVAASLVPVPKLVGGGWGGTGVVDLLRQIGGALAKGGIRWACWQVPGTGRMSRWGRGWPGWRC